MYMYINLHKLRCICYAQAILNNICACVLCHIYVHVRSQFNLYVCQQHEACYSAALVFVGVWCVFQG